MGFVETAIFIHLFHQNRPSTCRAKLSSISTIPLIQCKLEMGPVEMAVPIHYFIKIDLPPVLRNQCPLFLPFHINKVRLRCDLVKRRSPFIISSKSTFHPLCEIVLYFFHPHKQSTFEMWFSETAVPIHYFIKIDLPPVVQNQCPLFLPFHLYREVRLRWDLVKPPSPFIISSKSTFHPLTCAKMSSISSIPLLKCKLEMGFGETVVLIQYLIKIDLQRFVRNFPLFLPFHINKVGFRWDLVKWRSPFIISSKSTFHPFCEISVLYFYHST